MPGLRGIRNTAPYFHNNSADTLEEVVDHYIELFKFIKAVAPPPPVPPPPVASTDGVNFDRTAKAGGTRGAARVSEKAVEELV